MKNGATDLCDADGTDVFTVRCRAGATAPHTSKNAADSFHQNS